MQDPYGGGGTLDGDPKGVLEWIRGGIYIVVVEEIWMENHLMRVDKESWT